MGGAKKPPIPTQIASKLAVYFFKIIALKALRQGVVKILCQLFVYQGIRKLLAPAKRV